MSRSGLSPRLWGLITSGFWSGPHLKKVWASGLFSISTYQWWFLSKIIICLSLQYRWYPNVTLVHQTVRLIVYKIPGTDGHRTSANSVQIKQSPAVGCSPGEGRPAGISTTNTFPKLTIVRNLGVLPRNLVFLLLEGLGIMWKLLAVLRDSRIWL